MITFTINTEFTLITKFSEILNVRVYSDGFVKIGGVNMMQGFNTGSQANEYCKRNGIKKY